MRLSYVRTETGVIKNADQETPMVAKLFEEKGLVMVELTLAEGTKVVYARIEEE